MSDISQAVQADSVGATGASGTGGTGENGVTSFVSAQSEANQGSGQTNASQTKPNIPQSLATDLPSTLESKQNRSQNANETTSASKNEQKDVGSQTKGTLLTAQNATRSEDEYVFEFSPDTVVDTALIDSFKSFAALNNMSVESAKQMAAFYESYIQKNSDTLARQAVTQAEEMAQACAHDKEFGGARFQENLRYARAALTRFDDGTLTKILNESGFGSHPEVVRFMYRVGKSIGEKTMAVGQSQSRELSAAELFYPSMRKG